MVRKIAGAIVGYIALFIFIFATFSIAYLGMGADAAFEPGGYQVSMLWIVVSLVLGFIGAVIGGYVAALVGKGFDAVKILAGIILVLGIVTAVMVLVTPAPTEQRTAETSNMEAMARAQTPFAVALLNPILGIVGVIVGGRLRTKDQAANPA